MLVLAGCSVSVAAQEYQLDGSDWPTVHACEMLANLRCHEERTCDRRGKDWAISECIWIAPFPSMPMDTILECHENILAGFACEIDGFVW